MIALELLAPARNKDIGIAAIDSGADAVYIAGPAFGARKDAGNSVGDIAELCRYAHRFGARIFVTVNTTVEDSEMDSVHSLMLEAQEAGADAFIIRDERICGWDDIRVPLHASTQCSIRDARRALHFQKLGCARVVLERELSLEQVRDICSAVDCEVEFFVHGAICVCYNGVCRMSEYICGRSADRGECIQACRSLYDLQDGNGRTLVHNKALLSLKDYRLKNRLEDLAEAGVCSFKIEGRLKNASYVRNVTREYDIALNELVARHPDRYCRASAGRVRGGFVPDSEKTFNRGYTELYLDGLRGRWSSMDAPKSMGERIGIVKALRETDRFNVELTVEPSKPGLVLNNGDGFAFATYDGVTGFRGDVCSGRRIVCKKTAGLREGTVLFRNINSAFEKEIEANPGKREIDVRVDVSVEDGYRIVARAVSSDGRVVQTEIGAGNQAASNVERMKSLLESQLSKTSGHYRFELGVLSVNTADGSLPIMPASAVNSIRRELAESIDRLPCLSPRLATGVREVADSLPVTTACAGTGLMRSRYCVRYELGMCLKEDRSVPGPLYLVNNGRRFVLGFDCACCEMTVTPEQI